MPQQHTYACAFLPEKHSCLSSCLFLILLTFPKFILQTLKFMFFFCICFSLSFPSLPVSLRRKGKWQGLRSVTSVYLMLKLHLFLNVSISKAKTMAKKMVPQSVTLPDKSVVAFLINFCLEFFTWFAFWLILIKQHEMVVGSWIRQLSAALCSRQGPNDCQLGTPLEKRTTNHSSAQQSRVLIKQKWMDLEAVKVFEIFFVSFFLLINSWLEKKDQGKIQEAKQMGKELFL